MVFFKRTPLSPLAVVFPGTSVSHLTKRKSAFLSADTENPSLTQGRVNQKMDVRVNTEQSGTNAEHSLDSPGLTDLGIFAYTSVFTSDVASCANIILLSEGPSPDSQRPG